MARTAHQRLAGSASEPEGRRAGLRESIMARLEMIWHIGRGVMIVFAVAYMTKILTSAPSAAPTDIAGVERLEGVSDAASTPTFVIF